MRRTLALVFVCCASVSVPVALAQTQGSESTTPLQPTSSAVSTCTPLKAIYSEKNWRDRTPANGETPCPSKNARAIRDHFRLYRHYRQIAPYRCLGGSEGFFAIPCGIIECESHFSWFAANPSGAVGVYQLLGWGAPYPARTFRQRVENHEIAASLSLSNWVCS